MNISNISDQIEIAFWMGIVSLLRGRRVSRLMTVLLIVLLCLVALLLTAFSWSYVRLPSQQNAPKAAAIHTAAYLGRPDNGQKNLLLIVVDQLEESEPDLLGAWMLIYAPSGLRVTFMPIYPTGSEASLDVAQAFGLEKARDPSAAFKQVLESQGLWWDNYLVVDQAILAALVELSGGIDLGNGHSNGQQVVGLLPIAEQDSQTALELQARIAKGICQRFDNTLQNASPETIIELFVGGALSPSVHSDLTPEQLLASWTRMRGAGGLVCEFPTLIGR